MSEGEKRVLESDGLRKKSRVGQKTRKMRKGVFGPLRRVCCLDEIRGQLRQKNARFGTFLF